jgi:Helix-turn-helix domain
MAKPTSTKKGENPFRYLIAANDTIGLSAVTKLVLIMIAKHRNSKTGLCCPSLKTLMDLTGQSKSTVLRATDELKERGLVTWKRGWSNRYAKGVPNRYTLDLDAIEALSIQDASVTHDTRYSGDAGVISTDAGVKFDPEQPMQVSNSMVAGVTGDTLTVINCGDKVKSNCGDGELLPSEKSASGCFGVVSDSEDSDLNKTYKEPTITRTLTLPWMTEPSDFGSTPLPTLTGVRGDRRHSRLTFSTDKGLLNWLGLLDTRFDFRTPEDEIVTQLAPDGKWVVDTYGIAHVCTTNVFSTGLRDGDLISADITTGGKYCKLRFEFLDLIPLCGCGSRVFHMVRLSKDTGVLHTSTVCSDERCAFAKAQEAADDAVEQRESLTRHYGGSIPNPVALFNAHVPLGEKLGDAHQVFGAKQAVSADSRMWRVSGVGLVEGLTYQDAERSVQAQRDAYLDKKCLVGIV